MSVMIFKGGVCECGEPAVAIKYQSRICQRCLDFEKKRYGKAKRTGTKTTSRNNPNSIYETP